MPLGPAAERRRQPGTPLAAGRADEPQQEGSHRRHAPRPPPRDRRSEVLGEDPTRTQHWGSGTGEAGPSDARRSRATGGRARAACTARARTW
jgi:hypothetical protein